MKKFMRNWIVVTLVILVAATVYMMTDQAAEGLVAGILLFIIAFPVSMVLMGIILSLRLLVKKYG